MAAGASAAEAARRAGYSPKGAKQRGHFLMSRPEVRAHIDQLRQLHRAFHKAELDNAAEIMEIAIGDALDAKKPMQVMRAVEFRLKLIGVIQDRRITLHHHDDRQSPDAVVEDMAPDPDEWLDGLPDEPAEAEAPVVTKPAVTKPEVTNSDLPPLSANDPRSPASLIKSLKSALPPDFLDDLPASLLDDLASGLPGLSPAHLPAHPKDVASELMG
ncbi:hypothetical protein N825_11730 [Skermanella stibiiresistens SB22]|uniref:Terminase n=2 Tax=Skermanella TaxID=204447 RepID=W9GUD2_9PROT|nr:hypothetical protein N825_11730 [Skermanella stibiiresistens SB22]